MREQFEKLPKIAEILKRKDIYYGDYYGSKTYMVGSEPHGYLNGAWHVYQEQQKKIARLQSALDDLKEWAQDEKQKSLDGDLSEYNNAKYVMAALFVENINRITGTSK